MMEQSKALYPEKRNVGRAKYRSDWKSNNLLKYNPKSPLRTGYIRTLTCNEVRTVKTKKGIKTHHSSYCKNRWCDSCERIRMGKMINDFTPIFESMKEPYFVTLTCSNPLEEEASKCLDFMYKTFVRIMNTKKARQLRDDMGMHGIRKTECTQGLLPGRLHPHFHVLIDGAIAAHWLVCEWLKRMKGEAHRDHQNVKEANRDSLIELCKYFSKEAADKNTIDYRRLDAIYTTLRGRMLVRGFGGTPDFEDVVDSETEASVEETLRRVEELELTPREVQEEWEEESEESYYYNRKATDWVSEIGDLYCGFKPDDKDIEKYEERKLNAAEKEPFRLKEELSGDGIDTNAWINSWPQIDNYSNFLKPVDRISSRTEAKQFIDWDLHKFKLIRDSLIDLKDIA